MSSEKRKIAYIDGKPYEIGPNHTSILKFVKSYLGEKKVPTLCDDPNLAPYGACRVCSVEVALEKDGPTKVVASCHTPIGENQHVFTNNETLESLRKNIVELVISDHPMNCGTCEVDQNCELQTVANDLGIKEHRYNNPKQHKGIPKDTSHAYMRMNLDNCINCGRCVRACDEIQGSFVLTMSGRGFESRITTDNDMMFGDSSCVSCGACAHTCPTDAISDVFQSKSAKVDKKVRTTCSYCGVGCNLEASIKDGKVVAIDTPKETEVNAGHTCIKGRYAFGFYDHPDRLRSPLIKRSGKFEEASWDEAYDYIKNKLEKIIEIGMLDIKDAKVAIPVVLIAGLFWSFGPYVVRHIDEAQQVPWQYLFTRGIVIFIILNLFLYLEEGKDFFYNYKKIRISGLIGGVGLGIAMISFIYSITNTSAAVTLLCLAAMPFITALLGFMFLREEISINVWVAISIAAVGIVIMAIDNTSNNTLIGLVFGLLSSIGFAVFSTTLRWKKDTPKFTTVAIAGLFCCLFSGAMIVFNDLNFLSTGKNHALFATHGTLVCLGLILYSIGSKHIPAAELTLLSLTEVIGGIFWVWLPLLGINEIPSQSTVIGGFFIFLSIIYYSLIIRTNRRFIGLN